MKYASHQGFEPEIVERLVDMKDRNAIISREDGYSACLHSIALSMKRIADTLEEGLQLQKRK